MNKKQQIQWTWLSWIFLCGEGGTVWGTRSEIISNQHDELMDVVVERGVSQARLAVVLPPTMYSTAQVQLAMYEHVSMLGGHVCTNKDPAIVQQVDRCEPKLALQSSYLTG